MIDQRWLCCHIFIIIIINYNAVEIIRYLDQQLHTKSEFLALPIFSYLGKSEKRQLGLTPHYELEKK